MAKQNNKQVTKKEMVYAINLCISHIEELDKKVALLSGLLHNYIECKKDVDNLKAYLDDKKVKQTKQNKKETKDAD